MMQSLIICSSEADAAIAGKLRSYLEVNCPSVTLEETAVLSSANELLETVDRALSADLVLLLLSPDAIPSGWSREQWEPVLLEQPRELGSALAFVLLRACRFPEVLRRKKFFDLSADIQGGMRKIRRWLLEQCPLTADRIDALPPRVGASDDGTQAIAQFDSAVVDEPGVISGIAREAALTLAHANSRDFEGVFWLDCAGRSRAGVLGDTAHALGLKLTGSALENAVALAEFCARRRCLFVFDGLRAEDRELVTFKGSSSVVFTEVSGRKREQMPLAETVELFGGWRSNPESCLLHLREAEQYIRALNGDAPAHNIRLLKSLGASVFGLLRQLDRLAEAYEIVEILSKLAWEEGDTADLRRWEWEKSWIREHWGLVPSTRLRLGNVAEPAQLTLGF